MMEPMRSRQFNLRLSPEEAASFNLVAQHFGVNVSDMIRHLVLEQAKQLARPIYKLPALHMDVLRLLDETTPKSPLKILDDVARKHEGRRFLGNDIQRALVELTGMGLADRPSVAGWVVTQAGVEARKR